MSIPINIPDSIECTGTELERSAIADRRSHVQLDMPHVSVFERLNIYSRTVVHLGIANVSRVIAYRLCKKVGIYKLLLPRVSPPPLEFDASRTVSEPEAF